MKRLSYNWRFYFLGVFLLQLRNTFCNLSKHISPANWGQGLLFLEILELARTAWYMTFFMHYFSEKNDYEVLRLYYTGGQKHHTNYSINYSGTINIFDTTYFCAHYSCISLAGTSSCCVDRQGTVSLFLVLVQKHLLFVLGIHVKRKYQ